MPPTHQPALSLSERIAAKAEFIVNNLQETQYTHQRHIDEDLGIYDCDCSEFVTFVVHTIAPKHYAEIPFKPPHTGPLAAEYYLFFASLGLESSGDWSRIAALSDARRGDIIAWQLPHSDAGGDTGHVVFVAETPVQTGQDLFAVRIYDSANVPHFDESRADGDVESESGVGTGFIHFKVDAKTGAPTAFQFGPSEEKFVPVPIAIGRV